MRVTFLACAAAFASMILAAGPGRAQPIDPALAAVDAAARSAAPSASRALRPDSLHQDSLHQDSLHQAEQLHAWVVASGDNNAMPFAVVDKRAGRIWVYDADGAPLGTAAALVGAARGDGSTPHIGDRELSAIKPSERTTPAGRFVASYGPAADKAEVLWVDFPDAISLHAVVTANPKERRLERLKSPTAADNRITFGCINVPAAFYRDVVRPAFRRPAVVYVLPDSKPIEAVLPSFALYLRATAPAEFALAEP